MLKSYLVFSPVKLIKTTERVKTCQDAKGR